MFNKPSPVQPPNVEIHQDTDGKAVGVTAIAPLLATNTFATKEKANAVIGPDTNISGSVSEEIRASAESNQKISTEDKECKKNSIFALSLRRALCIS